MARRSSSAGGCRHHGRTPEHRPAVQSRQGEEAEGQQEARRAAQRAHHARAACAAWRQAGRSTRLHGRARGSADPVEHDEEDPQACGRQSRAGEWVIEGGRKRASTWVGFHTFRHTCATRLFRGIGRGREDRLGRLEREAGVRVPRSLGSGVHAPHLHPPAPGRPAGAVGCQHNDNRSHRNRPKRGSRRNPRFSRPSRKSPTGRDAPKRPG